MFRTESELNVWLLYCTARGLVIAVTLLEPVWYGNSEYVEYSAQYEKNYLWG